MKRILIILICLLPLFLFAQPIQQRATGVITVQDARLSAQYNFFLPRYFDTTAANLQKGIDSCGALIFTRSDNYIWYRQCTPKLWVQVGTGAMDTIYVDSPLLANATFDTLRIDTTTATGVATKFDLTQVSGVTPTLDQVAAAGNETSRSLYITAEDAGYYVTGSSIAALYGNGAEGRLRLGKLSGDYGNFAASRVSGSKLWQMPDSSGTVALSEYVNNEIADTAVSIRSSVDLQTVLNNGNEVSNTDVTFKTLGDIGATRIYSEGGIYPNLSLSANGDSILITSNSISISNGGVTTNNANVTVNNGIFLNTYNGYQSSLNGDNMTLANNAFILSASGYIFLNDSLINFPTRSGTLALLSDVTTTDTTSLSNRINTKLNATDTASLSNRINAKANTSNPTFTGSIQFPTVTTTQMNAISSPTDGLQVYNTTEKATYFYNSDWGWESDALSYKRKFGVEYFNELTTATVSDGIIVGSLSNGGTITAVSGVASRTGIQAPSTSTNAAARYTISTDATALVLGGGRVLFEESVRIPTLSNSTDAFYHFFGLSAQITAAAQTNGVLFLYDSSAAVTGAAASGRWQVMTAAASSRTFTTTSIQVTANQWYKLTGIVNAAGTSVQFYIDDVLVATHTTNIPTAAIGFVSNLQKTVGTTARTTNLDYLYFKQKYTTAR